jgi:tellurite resistance protein TerC
MDRFAYIKYGLASVLVFVGLKMVWLNEAFGGKFPIGWSLGIIAFLISSSIIISILIDRGKQRLDLQKTDLNNT